MLTKRNANFINILFTTDYRKLFFKLRHFTILGGEKTAHFEFDGSKVLKISCDGVTKG